MGKPTTPSGATPSETIDPRWEALLAELPEGLDALGRTTWLHRRLPADQARRVAELAHHRVRARGKLAEAERLWLSAKGLEQATERRVAARRAARIAGIVGEEEVCDGTAGIGGDLLELLRAGIRAFGVERDPETARLLRANLAATGLAARVVEGDVAACLHGVRWLVLDPDRRTGEGTAGGARAGGRRTSDPAHWSPSWDAIAPRLAGLAGGCFKLPPAFQPDRLALPEGLRRSWTWTSVDGELKELCLWTGALAWETLRSAWILRGDEAFELTGTPVEVPPLAPDEAPRVAWIADPDPAVVASGLLGNLAGELGGAPLGSGLGYVGGRGRPAALSPAARCYEVLDSVPLDRKRVRAMLAAHDTGPLVVKKRGLSESAAELAERLRGKGSRRGLAIAARLDGGRRLFLVRKLEN